MTNSQNKYLALLAKVAIAGLSRVWDFIQDVLLEWMLPPIERAVSRLGAYIKKHLPAMALPLWILVWIGVIALIRIINVISGLAIRKEFVALHTAVGKLTGALLFALPLTIGLLPLSYTGGIVCAVATFAAIQEGFFIRTGSGKI